MKLAFLLSSFPTLSETFILNQITGFIDLGHEVDIFADESGLFDKMHDDYWRYNLLNKTYYRPLVPQSYLFRVVKAIKIALMNILNSQPVMLNSLNFFRYGRKALSLRLFYDIQPFLSKRQYDVIICHFGPNGIKAVFLRRLGLIAGKIATSFLGHDLTSYPKQLGNSVYHDLFQNGDLFLPLSEHFKTALIGMGCNVGKISVHRMGVDLKSFSFSPRTIRNGETIRILSVARCVEKKGLEYGIRATAKLIEQYSNIEYLIVGDGPLRNNLQELINALPSGNHIRFIGSKVKADLIKLYKSAHIFLAPSVTAENGDQEGIPVALIEAMAMGIPVISTFHSGIPELITDGVTGLLVPERDSVSIMGKLRWLIENYDNSASLVSEARKHVENEYDVSRLNIRLEQLLQMLLRE